VGAWYTIGLFAGLGVALGVVLAGLFASTRIGRLIAIVLGAAAGVALSLVLADGEEAVGGAVGGALGALGATEIVRGALGRGGTRGGTAALVGLGAALVAGLAFVPLVGYAEAVVLPAAAARLRRRAGQRHAGLRILARD
jgi:hypothetical protein